MAKPKAGNTLIVASAGLPSSLEQESSLGYPNQEATQNMGTTLIRNPYVPVGTAGEFRQDIFKFEQLGVTSSGKAHGQVVATGLRPGFLERLKASGCTLDKDMFERRVLVRDDVD